LLGRTINQISIFFIFQPSNNSYLLRPRCFCATFGVLLLRFSHFENFHVL
jgi:hypothetical protein